MCSCLSPSKSWCTITKGAFSLGGQDSAVFAVLSTNCVAHFCLQTCLSPKWFGSRPSFDLQWMFIWPVGFFWLEMTEACGKGRQDIVLEIYRMYFWMKNAVFTIIHTLSFISQAVLKIANELFACLRWDFLPLPFCDGLWGFLANS